MTRRLRRPRHGHRLPSAREIRGLHHVQIAGPVGCEKAVRRFYGELLGLREIPKPAHLAVRGGVWFRFGSHELHVGVDRRFRSAWKFHPAFRVAHLADLRVRLERAGVNVFDDLPLPGHRRFYALDPFGNRLEFVEPRSARRRRPRTA